MSYLEHINSPDDVKKLDTEQLNELCGEIREFLIENVSETGGHLSSNLGTVELIVSLHKVFSSPQDVMIFDVGHQSYTHKLLTGRRDLFHELRKENGLSGFPCPDESVHDPMVEGHGNVALSQAIGIAQAKKLQGEPGKVIAVIGDGAFTGGMVYEAINNLAKLDNLLVVLNDNKMSISKNVGNVARYFARLRTDAGYNRAKRNVQSVLKKIPLLGPAVSAVIVFFKDLFRRFLYRSTWFEDMGFIYQGPIDGHDVAYLCNAFSNLHDVGKPIFYHVVTIKGKGFQPAEDNPGAFHGVPAFDVTKVPELDPDISPSDSFSSIFGQTLCAEAGKNKKICAITAAMKYGTGLQYMKKYHPTRMFDVGMAEQHAVTFAAGLAKGGMLPVVAIYSTFLQRAYDQIIHDVALNHANVLFAVDRAGLVPGDGVTHQGIYDVGFLSQSPDMLIVSPSNYDELKFWLLKLLREVTGPRAIRYSRGAQPELLAQLGCSEKAFDVFPQPNCNTAIVSYGTLFEECLKANEILRDNRSTLVKLTVIHPFSEELLQTLLAFQKIVFAEEAVFAGSIGQQLCEALQQRGYHGQFRHLTVSNFVDHATVSQLRHQQSLDAQAISKEVLR